MISSGQFVFNVFQVTPSLTPISQFEHTGHKRSFTVLFKAFLDQKVQQFQPHICTYVCGLQTYHSGRSIFEVFTLYIPNRFRKFQLVLEIQQFSETIFSRNHPVMPQKNHKSRIFTRETVSENCYISETNWNYLKRFGM